MRQVNKRLSKAEKKIRGDSELQDILTLSFRELNSHLPIRLFESKSLYACTTHGSPDFYGILRKGRDTPTRVGGGGGGGRVIIISFKIRRAK